ncbi:homocysteine S-methyltransferase [Luteitalea sp.]|jgi:homocysteine S-methyltransferase|uniref:homocysteine S-methyltransferase n=1 Tax=Luteitalea sp. TaxID=2004800 RepID=UPI0037C75786
MPHPGTRLMVLDGGLATELDARGFDLSDALWSARLLADAPDAIEAVHLDYFEAGADIAISASYQASEAGFAARGYSREDTDALLQRSVVLARAARDRFHARHPESGRTLRVAASIGPYGATLHDGSEYRGDYGLDEDALAAFHRPRLTTLLGAAPDLLACETIPSLLEARAIVRVLHEHPSARAWVTFTCRDGAHTSADDAIADCARFLDAEAQVVAIGINCVDPALVTSLVRAIARESAKPIVVYPNSGEVWNAGAHCWEGTATRFTTFVDEWIDTGASWLGGCCRTTPADIRRVRELVDARTIA